MKLKNANEKRNAEKLKSGRSSAEKHVKDSLTGGQTASDKLRKVDTKEKRENKFRKKSETHGGAALKKKRF